MSKFNKPTVRPQVFSPVTSTEAPGVRTALGAQGYLRDARSELFLLAVSNMVGEDTSYHESVVTRDARFKALIRDRAVTDFVWLAGMLAWLRSEGNMRSASVVGALEAVRARVERNLDGDDSPGRMKISCADLVDSVLQRADEPAEALAYWIATYGRPIPKPVKRGIARAARRLYSEFSLGKYDSAGDAFRFADVIDLTKPRPGTPEQSALFKYALDRRHTSDPEVPTSLPQIAYRRRTLNRPVAQRRELAESGAAVGIFRDAGMTWEAMAGWVQGPLTAKMWESIIPNMGLMALVRNLRNFDQAGVSDQTAARITTRLADPEEVRRSRMFPFRFLTAYNAAPSLRWSWPLEQALNHSLANVPALDGTTLVLCDRSPSMWQSRFSKYSDMTWADGAAIFAAALALRAESADLVEFGWYNGPVGFSKGQSVLKVVKKFGRHSGTDIPTAVKQNFVRGRHSRVVIVTDEQTRAGWLPSNWTSHYAEHRGMPETKIDDLVPNDVPLYMWNFGGYRVGAAPSGGGNRHTFGGLTDAAFRLIPLIERGRSVSYPWETVDAG